MLSKLLIFNNFFKFICTNLSKKIVFVFGVYNESVHMHCLITTKKLRPEKALSNMSREEKFFILDPIIYKNIYV